MLKPFLAGFIFLFSLLTFADDPVRFKICNNCTLSRATYWLETSFYPGTSQIVDESDYNLVKITNEIDGSQTIVLKNSNPDSSLAQEMVVNFTPETSDPLVTGKTRAFVHLSLDGVPVLNRSRLNGDERNLACYLKPINLTFDTGFYANCGGIAGHEYIIRFALVFNR